MNLKIENPAGGETMPGYEKHKINDVSVLDISSKKSSKLNRRRAVRHFCLDCSAGSIKDVRDCELLDCPLHEFRMGTGKQNPKKRSLAIRQYCLRICMMGQKYEVSICHIQNCPLYRFRNTSAPRQKSKNKAYTATSSDETELTMPVHDQGEL